jgi:hypothetical protein
MKVPRIFFAAAVIPDNARARADLPARNPDGNYIVAGVRMFPSGNKSARQGKRRINIPDRE